jgi:mannose-1-phosphate guanylyltransferase
MDDKLTRAAEDPLIKQDENLQLEQDVIVPLAASRKVYVFETTDFWRQMKTAAYVPSSLTMSQAYNVAPRSPPHPSTCPDTIAQPHLYSVNQTPQ